MGNMKVELLRQQQESPESPWLSSLCLLCVQKLRAAGFSYVGKNNNHVVLDAIPLPGSWGKRLYFWKDVEISRKNRKSPEK